MPNVFWSLLLERAVQEHNVSAMLDVAGRAGLLNYTRIFHPYSRTDLARSNIVKVFLERATDPDDVLVMLDNDHLHPYDIIERLAAHPSAVGVVGALAFRRGQPHYPCFFVKDGLGQFGIPTEWEPGALLKGTIVGTGAVAIKRWVFAKLDDAGFNWPYFRYTYQAQAEIQPSEDIYFGECCEQCGIFHYCDTAIETPHLTVATVDSSSWREWQTDHPEILEPGYDAARLFGSRFDAPQAEGQAQK